MEWIDWGTGKKQVAQKREKKENAEKYRFENRISFAK